MGSWSLQIFNMWTQRSLMWPILCLPFWWLAGRGVDGFLASLQISNKPSIRGFEAWAMALLGACIMILGTGLAFMSNAEEDGLTMRWLLVPGVIWFAFGIISWLAWWRQRKNSQSATQEMLSTNE